ENDGNPERSSSRDRPPRQFGVIARNAKNHHLLTIPQVRSLIERRSGHSGDRAAHRITEADSIAVERGAPRFIDGHQRFGIGVGGLYFGVLRSREIALPQDDVIESRSSNCQLLLLRIQGLLREAHRLMSRLFLCLACTSPIMA